MNYFGIYYKKHRITTFEDRVKERAYYLWLNGSKDTVQNYFQALKEQSAKELSLFD